MHVSHALNAPSAAQSVDSVVQSFPNEIARLNSGLKYYKLLFAGLGVGMGVLAVKTAVGRNRGPHSILCGVLCHDFLKMSYNCYIRAYVQRVMKHSVRDLNQFANTTLALVQTLFTGSSQSLRELQAEMKWDIILDGTLVERLATALLATK